jgi:hypothetical protein
LSECARWKLKKACEAGTRAIQQPGNASAPKQGETSTETPRRPRSDDSTPTKTTRPPKRPRDSSGPGNYNEALTNTKIAIFEETYPEDKRTEHDQELNMHLNFSLGKSVKNVHLIFELISF